MSYLGPNPANTPVSEQQLATFGDQRYYTQTLANSFFDDENRIINGDFGIWQRGTSFNAGAFSAAYAADRWVHSTSGGTSSLARQAFGVGDTLGGTVPQFFARYVTSGQSSSADYSIHAHNIESARSFAGETITILGWARRSAGAGNLAVELTRFYGSGGSPSATDSGIGVTPIVLTGSWAPFAVTVNVPTMAGKVLGTNGNDVLNINFWLSGGSTFDSRNGSLGLQTITVDFWGIHVRRGVVPASAAALYRPRHPAVELMLCQRYYETGRAYSGSRATDNLVLFYAPFKVTKRAIPIMTRSSTSTVAGNSVTISDDTSFMSGVINSGQIMNWTADAEL